MNLGEFDCSNGIIKILYNDTLNNLVVRTSTIKDMLLIDKLQKENSNAVGFIQKTIWEKYVFGGERNFVALICECNNDARRLKYGTALLDVCKQFCIKFHRIGFTLRCRTDLDSNFFWKSLGFEKYGVWEKGKINHVGFKASNDINLWKIDLNDNIKLLF